MLKNGEHICEFTNQFFKKYLLNLQIKSFGSTKIKIWRACSVPPQKPRTSFMLIRNDQLGERESDTVHTSIPIPFRFKIIVLVSFYVSTNLGV